MQRNESFRLSNSPALLLDLEELLTDQLRLVGGASYRRRLDLEAELSGVRRQLERLGFAPSRW
jgi:hypothetical protein